MGAILCCLRGPDDDEAPGCFPCLPWPFLINDHSSGAAAPPGAYARVAPVPIEGSTGSAREEDPMSTFRSPPMPLPYDDPQFRHHTEKSNLLRGESSNADARSPCADEKADGVDGPSLKAQPGGQKIGGTQVHVPYDCEDDCPICLEEYDYENPKMALQCSHGFHLACIYEWMERSQSCPVCAKVMMFNEEEEDQ